MPPPLLLAAVGRRNAANKNARYRDEYLLTHARKHNLVDIMKLQPA